MNIIIIIIIAIIIVLHSLLAGNFNWISSHTPRLQVSSALLKIFAVPSKQALWSIPMHIVVVIFLIHPSRPLVMGALGAMMIGITSTSLQLHILFISHLNSWYFSVFSRSVSWILVSNGQLMSVSSHLRFSFCNTVMSGRVCCRSLSVCRFKSHHSFTCSFSNTPSDLLLLLFSWFHTEYYYRWCCFPEHQATSRSLKCRVLCAESLLCPTSKPFEVKKCSHAVLSYHTMFQILTDRPKRPNYNWDNRYPPAAPDLLNFNL